MTVPIFPALAGLEFPVKRAPIVKTQNEQGFTGHTAAFPAWSYPQYRYELSFSVLRTQTDWLTLEGFIRKVKFSAGCLFQFQFDDDGSVTDQTFGVGDGATNRFQLVRTQGGFTEPVFCASAVTNVKASGSVIPAAGYSVDARGVVTFTTAPTGGALLTWTGTYNWYCRFDDDDAQLSTFAYSFWSLGKIAFTTVKSP